MYLRPYSRLTHCSPVRNVVRATAPRRTYVNQTSVQGARDRAAVGVFTPRAAALFVAVGAGLVIYFRSEKAKLEEQRRKERATTSYGRPDVGGPFQLTTQYGTPFSDQDLLGTYSLVYFGFTNCPDICPDELDKMSKVVDAVEKSQPPDSPLRLVKPVFVSVDPARDSVEDMRRYAQDFHPRLIALTGPYDAIKKMCKVYRVYFSTPPDVAPGSDYLVDHSIYFYLMDPEGNFVNAFGRSSTAEEVTTLVEEQIQNWGKGRGSA